MNDRPATCAYPGSFGNSESGVTKLSRTTHVHRESRPMASPKLLLAKSHLGTHQRARFREENTARSDARPRTQAPRGRQWAAAAAAAAEEAPLEANSL